jgi:hypothetical protein
MAGIQHCGNGSLRKRRAHHAALNYSLAPRD